MAPGTATSTWSVRLLASVVHPPRSSRLQRLRILGQLPLLAANRPCRGRRPKMPDEEPRKVGVASCGLSVSSREEVATTGSRHRLPGSELHHRLTGCRLRPTARDHHGCALPSTGEFVPRPLAAGTEELVDGHGRDDGVVRGAVHGARLIEMNGSCFGSMSMRS